jgi:hypothetical protein
MEMRKIGEWAFLACVVIAILAGIAIPADAAVVAALVVLGIIVGLLNISEKETTAFLIAAIALMVAGTAGFSSLETVVAGLGNMVTAILSYRGVFVAPAAVIVALKAVWAMGKKK